MSSYKPAASEGPMNKEALNGIPSAALEAAFHAHKEGHTKFTRRMAINIADHFGTTPRHVTQQLEKMTLLKSGSWRWFVNNGGFSKENFAETRIDRAAFRPQPTGER